MLGNCQEGRDLLPALYSIESVPLRYAGFRSGPDETRTRNLRHAKAAQYFARGFSSLQNACKSSYLLIDALLKASGVSLGLLHGCCTKRCGTHLLRKRVTRLAEPDTSHPCDCYRCREQRLDYRRDAL